LLTHSVYLPHPQAFAGSGLLAIRRILADAARRKSHPDGIIRVLGVRGEAGAATMKKLRVRERRESKMLAIRVPLSVEGTVIPGDSIEAVNRVTDIVERSSLSRVKGLDF